MIFLTCSKAYRRQFLLILILVVRDQVRARDVFLGFPGVLL